VRIGLDGTPLGYERLLDTPIAVVGGVQAFARPGGLMTVASMWQIIDDAYVSGVYMVGMDTALAPVSQHLMEGQSLWLQATAQYPDGSTLLAIQFSGLLELGPLGVGVQGGTYGSAITAVNDEGDARWAEVIYPTSYVEVPSIAAATDGSVYVAALVDPGTVLDGEVFDGSVFDGVVLAKLRP
jgi:hypothetical protein